MGGRRGGWGGEGRVVDRDAGGGKNPPGEDTR